MPWKLSVVSSIAVSMLLSQGGQPAVALTTDLPTQTAAPSQLSAFRLTQQAALSMQTLKLGDISLLSTEAQVRAALGQPASVKDSNNPLIGGDERYLFYEKNGINAVQLVKHKATGQFVVFSVLVSDAGAATHKGIQVKDPVQKVIAAYGKPSSVEAQGDTVDVLYYATSDKQAYIAFTVLGDRVTEIMMSRQVALESQTPTIVASRSIQPMALPPTAQLARAPLSVRNLEIGGISTNSTEAQVRARLGQPQRVEAQYWSCCGEVKVLHYGTTKVNLIEGNRAGVLQVFALSTQRTDLPTRNGIRVGNSQQHVLTTLGKPASTKQDGGITTLFYQLEDYAASLWFRMQHGKVIEMGYTEQLN